MNKKTDILKTFTCIGIAGMATALLMSHEIGFVQFLIIQLINLNTVL